VRSEARGPGDLGNGLSDVSGGHLFARVRAGGRWSVIAAIVVAAAIIVTVVLVERSTMFSRIEAAEGWNGPEDCVSVSVQSPSPSTTWTRWVMERASTSKLVCNIAGGALDYAAFGNKADLERSLRRARSAGEPLCVVGESVIGDASVGSLPDPFRRMCSRLGGRVIPWRGQV
jgi:hypothetical protein